MSLSQYVDEGSTLGPRRRFRAQLFGGDASGLILELSALVPKITVFQNGGPAFALAADEGSAAGDARRLGGYELVGPVGPETPVYVATS
jgi:hypothetical protein